MTDFKPKAGSFLPYLEAQRRDRAVAESLPRRWEGAHKAGPAFYRPADHTWKHSRVFARPPRSAGCAPGALHHARQALPSRDPLLA